MHLDQITTRIGDYTADSILITEAEPIENDGPRIVWCNAAFTRMTGYTLDELVGQTPRLLHGAETERAPLDRIKTALKAWHPVVDVVRNYTKDGRPFWVEISILPVADDTGWYRYWVSIQRDVTERMDRELALERRNTALAASERKLQDEKLQLAGIAAVAEHAQELISITDTDFRVLWANPAFVKRSGYSLAAMRGLQHCALLNKRNPKYASREVAIRAILDGTYNGGEVLNTNRHGEDFWTDIRVSVQRDALGQVDRFVVVERDITEERKQRQHLVETQRELSWAAVHDPLTELPNRRGFDQALDVMKARAQSLNRKMALMHIDLDHFKQINDTLGHAAGDAVLTQVTQRLQGFMGPDSCAGRIGGDEFLVATVLAPQHEDVETRADRLRQHLSQPVAFGNAECRFGASIGYTVESDMQIAGSDMQVRADIALYRAKRNGRNLVQGFTKELAAETTFRKTMADDLRVAIEQGQIRAVYQPQVCAKTRSLVGMATLMRWDHPKLGLLSPGDFQQIAREMSLEAALDRLIMEYAVIDRAYLKSRGLDVAHVSINISSHRLRAPLLLEQVESLIHRGDGIYVELLESAFLDDETDLVVTRALDGLRRLGVGLAIDDFGTGHASVMGLVRVKPDRLKTDASLIRDVETDPERRRLFELMIEVGHTLGIPVTAEGIETEAQAQIARDAGCDVLQGYLFGRAMTTVELLAAFSPEPCAAAEHVA